MKFKRGMQIVYVPPHASGDISHANSEFGFITGVNENLNIAFCRYWSKFDLNQLRTRANSEPTMFENLVYYVSRPQEKIDRLLEELS